jgi:Fur family zinc uptake transcriptional regulator
MARKTALPTHPRELVLAALKASRKPMPAYAILEKLRPHGVNSPPIIYRALASLARAGKVHRIASISAYIACNCAPGHAHALSVLTICEGCKRVDELHDHAVIHHLEKLRQFKVALPSDAVVELPVHCGRCGGL